MEKPGDQRAAGSGSRKDHRISPTKKRAPGESQGFSLSWDLILETSRTPVTKKL
jgi:hypothetical protein